MEEISKQELLDVGASILMTFLSGPKAWAEIPSVQVLDPEAIRGMESIIKTFPNTGDATWLESQKAVCHAVIEMLGAEIMTWCVLNNRQDLLKTCVQILREAKANGG